MTIPGIISMWGGSSSTIPAGYLPCDGTLVNRYQYPALFEVIQFNFGGNPPDGLFYLPDLRGRFIRGVDDGARRDPDIGSRTDMQNSSIMSQSVGSIQSHAFQNHNHEYRIFPGGEGDLASGRYWQGGTDFTSMASPDNYQVSTETRPINVYLNFIISY